MKMNLKRKLKAVKNLLFVKIAHAYSEVTYNIFTLNNYSNYKYRI